MYFTYVVIDQNGIRIIGRIEADTLIAARKQLEYNQYDIVEIKKVGIFARIISGTRMKKLKSAEIIMILTHIATLDKVGLSILNILDILRKEAFTSQRMKRFCDNVYSSVSTGKTLSESITQQNAMDPIVSVFIKASEDSGSYYKVLTKVVNLMQWSHKMHAKVNGAIIKGLGSIALIVIMLFVVSTVVTPRIIDFLVENEIPIPWYTALFSKFSKYISRIIIIIAAILAIIFLTTVFMTISSEKYAYYVDRAKLSIPLIGDIMIHLEASRFLSFLMIMYDAGEHIENIIEDLSNSTSNRYVKEHLHSMASLIKNGTPIDIAIERIALFPDMANRMLSIGIDSNNVVEVLKNAVEFIEQEIKTKTQVAIDSIRPATIFFAGGLVLWMALSIFSPIYSNINNLAADVNQSRTAI